MSLSIKPIANSCTSNLKMFAPLTTSLFCLLSSFKTQQIIAEGKQAQAIFESSTTTGATPSKHFVADLSIYETSFLKGFEAAYGNPKTIYFWPYFPPT
jgi:threonine/homoserine/homoserine lactone efflux protein